MEQKDRDKTKPDNRADNSVRFTPNTPPEAEDSAGMPSKEAMAAELSESGIGLTAQAGGQDREGEGNSFLKAVRTFRGDVESMQKRTSIIGIAAKEEARRGQRSAAPNAEAQKKRSWSPLFIAGGMLFIIGGGALFAAFWYSQDSSAPAETRAPQAPIAVNTTELYDTTGKNSREVLQDLAALRESVALSLGEVAYIAPITAGENGPTLVPAPMFLSQIDAGLEESFERTLRSEFMLGVHSFNGAQPFMLLAVSDFRNAFAGMLAWEPALAGDLDPFFDAKSTLGTSTPAFVDRVIRNIDTRVLLYEGETLLLYAFLNDGTILITTNEHTLAEVITRGNSRREF